MGGRWDGGGDGDELSESSTTVGCCGAATAGAAPGNGATLAFLGGGGMAVGA